jgi:hypothetical protein
VFQTDKNNQDTNIKNTNNHKRFYVSTDYYSERNEKHKNKHGNIVRNNIQASIFPIDTTTSVAVFDGVMRPKLNSDLKIV